MNAEKLAQYVNWLVKDEGIFEVQTRLNAINRDLVNISANPQVASYQTELVEDVQLLETEIVNLVSTYDEVQWKGVLSIGAGPYFSSALYESIRFQITNNAITPSVAQTFVANLLKLREDYLSTLRYLKEGLVNIGIIADSGNDPEIGFQIPRDIFHNNLDGLIIELRAIRRIIGAFAEITSGSMDEIQVRQISSTDPTFYFGIPAATIAALGYAVVWSLERWKQIEDIRKVRAETRKLSVFSSEEVEQIFGTKIKEIVSVAVEEKVTELVGPSDVKGRKAEQRKLVSWALEAILARVERGMVVEIRLPPPASAADTLEEGATTVEDPQTVELRQIKSNISFPQIDRNPVLSLPTYDDENQAKKEVNPKKTS